MMRRLLAPVLILGVLASGCAPAASTITLSPAPAAIPTTTATPIPGGQDIVDVTGHALYELSGTEFVFSDGAKTYDVTMDESTQCVNLRGKLLGGSQFISRIIMVTSLPITVTGTLNGSAIRATTVLVPTTKDAIT